MRYFYLVVSLLLLTSCGDSSTRNNEPILNYDAPAEVNENLPVTISSTSTDPDGFIRSHDWSQISGPEVSLSVIDETSIIFLAPDVKEDTPLVFSLKVTDNNGATISSGDITVKVLASDADNSLISDSNISFQNSDLPYINVVEIDNTLENLESITYRIKTRSESIVKDFTGTYKNETLSFTEDKISIPLMGFYANYLNQVEFSFSFNDGSQKVITKQHQTANFDISTTVEVLSRPNETLRPSFDYFYIKRRGGPMLVDIDGYTRWVNTQSSWSIYFDDQKNVFYFGSGAQFGVLKLDGTISVQDIVSDELLDLEVHHEVSKGKIGHLVEVNGSYDGETKIIESILLEVDDAGNQINIWDMGKIFRNYMITNNDDPSNFVIDGEDWCHMNSSIYNPDDDSLLISCREDFVAKIDYSSKEIKWLLGDETKHWYQNFPSLRELSLNSLDTKPIGQHALSIHNGNLSLFNNGFNSFRQPEGAPNGINLDESRATIYEIDEVEKTATVVFDYTDNIYSDICSSFYSDKYSGADKDFLVLYTAVNRLNLDEEWYSLIRGLNADKQILFEFKIPKERGVNQPCRDGWNAQIFNSSLIFE